MFLSALRAPDPKNKQALLQQDARLGEPVVVHTGPARKPGEPKADPKGGKPKSTIANVTPAGGPELASRSDDGVPTPRSKPKIVRTPPVAHATTNQSAATQAAPKPAAPKPAAPKADASKSAPKTAAKTATKSDAKPDPKLDPKTDAKKK